MIETKKLVNPGIVYILRNSALRETVVKIGRTNRSAEIRASELSRPTGIPKPFEVLYEEAVGDCEKAEKLIHQRLSNHRINQSREFFDLPLKEAVRAVFETCLIVNSEFLKERSRLAIWIKPGSVYIEELQEWLHRAPQGSTSIRLIMHSGNAHSEMLLSNTLLISCTPEMLIEIRRKSWVNDIVYAAVDYD